MWGIRCGFDNTIYTYLKFSNHIKEIKEKRKEGRQEERLANVKLVEMFCCPINLPQQDEGYFNHTTHKQVCVLHGASDVPDTKV